MGFCRTFSLIGVVGFDCKRCLTRFLKQAYETNSNDS